jgi:nucleotide-binding universal stress UspA family protein
MLPYKTILVPLDGSELAERSVPHALELAAATGARVHLASVFELPGRLGFGAPTPGGGGERPPRLYEQRLAEHRRCGDYLGSQAAKFVDAGVAVEWSVLEGVPAEVLSQLAAKLPADLIVMTSRGQGGLKRLVLGSVANELLRLVELPVLIVRPGAGD